MSNKKGKFRDGKGTIDSTGSTPKFSVPGSEIVEIHEEQWGSIISRWVKSLLGYVVLFIVVVAVIATALFATILVYSPVDETSNREIVARNTFAQTKGKPPINTEVVISQSQKAPDNILDWVTIGWTAIPYPATMKIASTDYDKLLVEGDADKARVLNLNDANQNGDLLSSIEYPLAKQVSKEKDTFRLNVQLKNNYLMQCVSGYCEEGSYYIISKDQIFGEVKTFNKNDNTSSSNTDESVGSNE